MSLAAERNSLVGQPISSDGETPSRPSSFKEELGYASRTLC